MFKGWGGGGILNEGHTKSMAQQYKAELGIFKKCKKLGRCNET